MCFEVAAQRRLGGAADAGLQLAQAQGLAGQRFDDQRVERLDEEGEHQSAGAELAGGRRPQGPLSSVATGHRAGGR